VLPDHLTLLLGQELSCDRVDQVEGDSKGAEYTPHAQGQPTEGAWPQSPIQLPEEQQTHTDPRQSSGHVGDVGDRGSRLQLLHGQLSGVKSIAQIAKDYDKIK